MVLMGVVACEMFKDIVVSLLAEDEDIDTVYMDIESDFVEKVTGSVKKFDNSLKRVPVNKDDKEMKNISPRNELDVFLSFQEMGLHRDIKKLRKETLETIKDLQELDVDWIFLFYGLCGNAFKNLNELTENFNAPVEILRDPDKDKPVDDCIVAELGGVDNYFSVTRREPGSFFLTSMWSKKWREMFQKANMMRGENDIEGAKIVFNHAGYKRAVKIETEKLQQTFQKDFKEFKETFSLKGEKIDGTLELVMKNWENTKSKLKQVKKPECMPN